MKQWLDNLQWGNPDMYQLQIIKKSTDLSRFESELKEYPYPSTLAGVLKIELTDLWKHNQEYQKLDSEKQEFYKQLAKKTYPKQIEELLPQESRAQWTEIAGKIISELKPLLTKLAFYYNRPTPAHSARHYDFAFFPAGRLNDAPTYPNIPYTTALVLRVACGNMHPDKTIHLDKFIADIEMKELYFGQTWPSDLTFSELIAEKITSDPAWNKKYNF